MAQDLELIKAVDAAIGLGEGIEQAVAIIRAGGFAATFGILKVVYQYGPSAQALATLNFGEFKSELSALTPEAAAELLSEVEQKLTLEDAPLADKIKRVCEIVEQSYEIVKHFLELVSPKH